MDPSRGLVLRGVRARAGAFGLGPVDLEVAPGQVLAVLGPSGAGKTVMLDAIAGFRRVTSGAIELNGHDITRLPPEERRIGVVFQHYALFPHLSVAENVRFGPRALGSDSAAAALDLLQRVGIAHLADRRPATLSGGERQRVALARALAIGPRALLLDEPLSALDTPTREELTADLGRVLHQSDVATVLVTHDRDEALTLGDRVAVILSARIRQIDEAEVVFSMPADPDIAAFVGVENVIPARVERVTEDLTVLSVADLPVEVVAMPPPGESFPLLCVRPDDIVITREPVSSSARNAFAGRIVRIERIGRRARLILDCGFPLVAHVTIRTAHEMGLREGEDVTAVFKATVPHLVRRSRGSGRPTAEERSALLSTHVPT